ncbi:hypothetical protein T07_4188 [Trichinella nelsoni]|uniref:Uncharacterized protein n=1 Tax=Trichinella nelsoni TaxID=6336 RepID=A0A0V0RE25_9BILA|nr:hypothetical protein T07_4188 [Trichinella nelsoni]
MRLNPPYLKTTRERLQPLRLLDGSLRKADNPLALATEVVIYHTPITHEEKSLNMVRPTKMIIWVKIARRHGPHDEMRCRATDCADETCEKITGMLRQYVETTSMPDGDLGRSSVREHRLRKFVESVKPIKKALSRLSIREEEAE